MTRIALITGGSLGLGRASARALADDGTDIIVTYRSNPEEANAVVAELSGRGRTAIALPLDVTDHRALTTPSRAPRSQRSPPGPGNRRPLDARSRSLFTPEPAPRRSSSEPAEPTISPGA